MFLWDDLTREVRRLSLAYPEGADTFHNVSQLYYSFADTSVGSAIDLEVGKLTGKDDQLVYVLHGAGISEIARAYDSASGTWQVTSHSFKY